MLIHRQILSFKKTCQNMKKKQMYAKNENLCQGFGKFLVAKFLFIFQIQIKKNHVITYSSANFKF